MNIWSISKYATVPKYGRLARTFILAKEFVKQGHKVLLLTSDANHLAKYPKTEEIYNFDNIDGIEICLIKTKKYQKTASFSRVLSWLDFERRLFKLNRTKLIRPDIILVSSLSIFTILYGYYLKRKYKVPLVFEIRDIWPLTMVEEGNFSKWHPLVLLIGWIEKFGYKKSDLIVGTMPNLNEHIKNVIGYNRPFFCAPFGFDKEFYVNESANQLLQCSQNLPKGKIIIGYAGSMGITNNLSPLIAAIKLLQSRKDIFFALAGDGDLRLEFEDELNDCQNVLFLGELPHYEVNSFLMNCSVVYLSTKKSKVWSYGQSMNKVVEYMLAAKPILASYTGYQSMINEAECGKFISTDEPAQLKNEILSICNLTERERLDMGSKGREWILKHRSYDLLASEYIEQLERLIE